jgi:hypothetical protein
MVCWVLDDAQIRRQFKRLSDSDLDSIEAEAKGELGAVLPGLEERIHRHVSFKKHAPDKPERAKYITVKDEGDLEHEAEVGGGEVEVRTDVEAKMGDRKFEEMFSLRYKGKQSSKTQWLQFIWREIQVDDPVKGTFCVDEEISTTGGSYRLTTDSKKPNYNTDSADKDNPFYETAGAAIAPARRRRSSISPRRCGTRSRTSSTPVRRRSSRARTS